MGLIGLGLFGVLVGAAGAELLRAGKPDVIEHLEKSAKRLVDRCFGKSREDAPG